MLSFSKRRQRHREMLQWRTAHAAGREEGNMTEVRKQRKQNEKMTLGAFIRSLRLQNGMTQAKLADKVGITDKAVSKWERDVSYPDVALFPKLADVLGVSVCDLLDLCIEEGQPSRLMQIFKMTHDIRTPLHTSSDTLIWQSFTRMIRLV
jgi:transcriptional regulator with XRE-family HTH domain